MGGCTGSSESTLIKMPHCWKSHVMAQMLVIRTRIHKMLARIANREDGDQTRVCTVLSRQATSI